MHDKTMTAGTRTLSTTTSIYLDVARTLAAFAVFGTHMAHNLTPEMWWRLGPTGGVAVAVFFVLSGFVISNVASSKANTPGKYVTDRVSRILSVAIPALALTYVLQTGTDANLGLADLVRSLTFTNEAWTHATFGNNVPYWSLGFEVPYYAVFAMLIFLPRPWNALAGMATLCLIGPKVAILFPLWLIGCATHRICARATIRPWQAWVLLAAPLPLFAFGIPMPFGVAAEALAATPERLLTIARDYEVGFAFAAHLVGFNALFGDRTVGARTEAAIRWIAGGTFSLYLYHFPILIALARVWPYPQSDWRTWAVAPAIAIALTYALAEVTERRKRVWQRAVRRFLTEPIMRATQGPATQAEK